VLIERDGQLIVRQDMLWGFPVQVRRRLRHQLPQPEEPPVARLARREHRCVVPATAFSEPDRNTPKDSVVWRWFARADKQPFFFTGIWRPWTGDRGTRKVTYIGDHTLFDHDDGAQRHRRADP
jgi:putative SOS response-associated peptidase YedK